IINSLSQSSWTEFSVGNIFLKDEALITIKIRAKNPFEFKIIVNRCNIIHSGEVIAINQNNKEDKILSTFSGYITAITLTDSCTNIQFKYHPIII
ncbi:hypothetical protein, partial [Providencia stuartii]|uniref:hypothetical protein n=3 Tax=Providencia TaxID=586 RepID=UPI00331C0FD0